VPGKVTKKAACLTIGIDNMMGEALISDKKHRQKDLGHFISHANIHYGRVGQVARLSAAEFVAIKDFEF